LNCSSWWDKFCSCCWFFFSNIVLLICCIILVNTIIPCLLIEVFFYLQFAFSTLDCPF
jgi:hypothetical protein